MTDSSIRVLAAASGGGHWEQLMLLRDCLDQYDVRFATTEASIAHQRGIETVETLPDCNQNRPFRSLLCAFVAAWIVLKVRPAVVVSTGAAPGYFCLLAGRLIGARTLWIDSVANGEQLSMCGKLSKRTAHACLTQWEHLADEPKGQVSRSRVVILVTVGMQLGFDRLIKAMDAIAPTLDQPVVAQTGKGTYQPIHMEAREQISPSEFEQLVQRTRSSSAMPGLERY